jgi:hypothetical protein
LKRKHPVVDVASRRSVQE